MAICTYCGKSAGLFRTHHAECRAQFERAATTIPAFFEKLLQSALPPERFSDLLSEVAATFHIQPNELRSLSIAGVHAMLESVIARHLPTPDEQSRIVETITALGLSLQDLPDIETRLVKIDILRDLQDGKTPDHVTVSGPLPFNLSQNETIIWIFNNSINYRQPKGQTPAAGRAASPVQANMPHYFSPANLGQQPASVKDLEVVGERDLVVTSQSLYVVLDERHGRIPLSTVTTFDTYSDGFRITRKSVPDRPLTFIVDDPWFAANLFIGLLRRAHKFEQPPRQPARPKAAI
jgi:hypothetical protein